MKQRGKRRSVQQVVAESWRPTQGRLLTVKLSCGHVVRVLRKQRDQPAVAHCLECAVRDVGERS